MIKEWDRRQCWFDFAAALFVAVLAGWVRFWWIDASLRDLPYATHPLNDARMYWEMGLSIYRQGWLLSGEGPFYQAPLYSYFLAILHHLDYHRVEAVMRWQVLLEIGNVVLCYALARQYLAIGWAVLTALLFGFCHFSFFYETKLLAATLGLFLFLSFSLFFVLWLKKLPQTFEAIRREGYKLHCPLLSSSAILYSLAVLCRPNMLFTFPFILLVTVLAKNRSLKPALLFFCVCVLGILPVTIRNVVVGGDFVPICANSGVTLYMGTNPSAQGGLSLVEGLSNDIADQKEGSIQLASRIAGRELSPSEASNFWIEKTVKWAISNPVKFTILQAKKLLWSLYHSPPSVNYSAHFESHFFPALSFFKFVTWLSLFGGLAGLPFIVHTQNRLSLFLASIAAGYLLLSLVYYASDRFLASILPFTSITAVVAVKTVSDWVKQKHGQGELKFDSKQILKISLWLIIVLALTANPFLAWNADRESGMGWYIMGLYHSEQGDNGEALLCYEKAIDSIPNFPSLLLNLGVLYGQRGELERSSNLFERVLALDPNNQTARDNLEINRRRLNR